MQIIIDRNNFTFSLMLSRATENARVSGAASDDGRTQEHDLTHLRDLSNMLSDAYRLDGKLILDQFDVEVLRRNT